MRCRALTQLCTVREQWDTSSGLPVKSQTALYLLLGSHRHAQALAGSGGPQRRRSQHRPDQFAPLGHAKTVLNIGHFGACLAIFHSVCQKGTGGKCLNIRKHRVSLIWITTSRSARAHALLARCAAARSCTCQNWVLLCQIAFQLRKISACQVHGSESRQKCVLPCLLPRSAVCVGAGKVPSTRRSGCLRHTSAHGAAVRHGRVLGRWPWQLWVHRQ